MPFKINPISEAQADNKVKVIYEDIKSLLEFHSIPYFFQIIANSELFLDLLWKRLKPVLDTQEFEQLVADITNYSLERLRKVRPTEPTLSILVSKIDDNKKGEYTNEFFEMVRINCLMVAISIMVRESIKGLAIISEVREHFKIISGSEKKSLEERFAEVEKESEEKALATMSNQVGFAKSTDPYFLTYIKLVSELMETFFKSNEYLEVRLLTENKVQELIKALPNKLDLPYGQILEILYHHSWSNELIFLLHDLLPGYYPKQFISSLLLVVSLEVNKGLKSDIQDEIALPLNDTKLLN